MEENNEGNFLDKNTLMAIGLSIFVFLGWQMYLQKKYPDMNKETAKAIQAEATAPAAAQDVAVNNDEVVPTNQPAVAEVAATTQSLESEKTKAELSSKGMGLTRVELLNYSDRDSKNIEFVSTQSNLNNLGTDINGEALNFQVQRTGNDNQFVGVAQGPKGIRLTKSMKFNPENYSVDVEIKVDNPNKVSGLEINTVLTNKALDIPSSFLTPAYEGTEFFVINDGSEERNRVDISESMKESYAKASLTSIGSQYFAVALKDESPLMPSSKVNFDSSTKNATAVVSHQLNGNDQQTIAFTGFIGPKKYDLLKDLGPEYVQMINYGMFSALSKPILSMLKRLFTWLQNWGLAIIILTVIIRLILLPINISSLRSMKKMQKIQPQLKAIKEKYKDDPVRVNQETMALMKKEKANPIGGCLPMLLQLPVFLALYSVLGQSVELYKAPFAFWIQDLSIRDPFFVLPVAVGVLYFLQMNLTPQTNMDPTQAKIMKFMPLMFVFFMVTVPSGLVLYFFVNTIFGIGQQLIFQRDRRKQTA